MISPEFTAIVLKFFLPAAVTAICCTAIVRSLAPRWGLLDHPDQRKTHARAIPLGGGLAVAAGMCAALAFGGFSMPSFASRMLLFAPAFTLLLLGLIDDYRRLSQRFRLTIHALCAVSASFAIEPNTALLPEIAFRAATAFVVTMLINSFNMLDHTDALASGTALIASVQSALLALQIGPHLHDEAILLLASAGAIAGFLIFNFPPASIFLGDSGSYWIGFFTAWGAASVCCDPAAEFPYVGPFLAVILCLIPLYDSLTVVAVRLCEGRSPFEADRCHVTHRLTARGSSRGAATAIVCGVAAVVGSMAVVAPRLGPLQITTACTLVIAATIVIGIADVRGFLILRRKTT